MGSSHRECDVLQLQEILNSTVDDRCKGIPGAAAPFRLADIHQQGWNVLRQDLNLPLAVLRATALRHNVDWMSRFTRASGVQLCPHGKTTMSPQLFDAQLRAGAWGITAATIGHVQIYRRFGVKRILLANQLVGPKAIAYVLEELRSDPEFDFYCLVDSPAAASLLAQAARNASIGRPLQVLLEVGERNGRTGARSVEDRLRTAQAIARSGVLALRGVEGFEGVAQVTAETTDREEVRNILQGIVDTAALLGEAGLFADGPVILSAGGSAFFDVAARQLATARLGREVVTVIRSGCYITHDSEWCHSFFQQLAERETLAQSLGEGLKPALELWAYVQSRPEPDRVIATFGKRDCSSDAGLPVPLRWFRPGVHERPQSIPGPVRVTRLNDQHAYLEIGTDSPLAVGDMICVGISHPCTTFDKWQLLPVVNDDYDVVSAVRTFF
jgi:D-serine dehydratase